MQNTESLPNVKEGLPRVLRLWAVLAYTPAPCGVHVIMGSQVEIGGGTILWSIIENFLRVREEEDAVRKVCLSLVS